MMIIPASRRRCGIDNDGAADCLDRRVTTQNSTLTSKGDDRRGKADLGIVTFTRLDTIAPKKPNGRGCAVRSVHNAHFIKMLQHSASRRRYRQAYINLS